MPPADTKTEILRLTAAHTRMTQVRHLPGEDFVRQAQEFIPGLTPIPYAGRCFDEQEVSAAVASALDFWLTLGKEGEAFEAEFAAWLGVKSSLLTNSGSSANLLAVAALTSSKLGHRRLKRGDEVITVAAGFPTTVAPLIQHGLVPVFIDSDPITLNARVDQLEAARSWNTKAVFMAHTLGNPFDLATVTAFCEKHGLWLIEDNCDALGSTYNGQLTGTFGQLSTQSFYPPHHMTMGEGGAVNFNQKAETLKSGKTEIQTSIHPPSSMLRKLAESFRDWGRDCWCASGVDNTCHKRYGWKLGDLPAGYDHKHTFSHLGYNLKPLDISAAIGRVQLRKLAAFTAARRRNWQTLRAALAGLEEYFDFMLPCHATAWKGNEDGGWKIEDGQDSVAPSSILHPPSSAPFTWDDSGNFSDPSWFGFMLMVKPGAPFTRRALADFLEARRIGSRMLFGGNLVRQPAFTTLLKERPLAFRVVGELAGADRIMNDGIFVGVYPGLTPAMLDYMAHSIREFCEGKNENHLLYPDLQRSQTDSQRARPRLEMGG